MKVVAISDLHGTLPKDMPEGDVLCICGDICPLDIQRDTIACVAWFNSVFNVWANSLPYKKVIFIAGNHDFFLQDIHSAVSGTDITTWRTPSTVMKRLLPLELKGKSKLIYLCDNSVEIEGIRFYGTPWIADLANWAFYLPKEELIAKYNSIPKKVDVLLTHMPSATAYTGDVLQHGCYNTTASYGSFELSNAIACKDIKWALCGHVHSGNHTPTKVTFTNEHETTYVNVSLKNEDYKVTYKPFEFEI